MTWKKVPAWKEPIAQGCLSCAPVTPVASMGTVIAAGFGAAHVTKGEMTIFAEGGGNDHHYEADLLERMEEGAYPTLDVIEELAAEDPDHDWRFAIYGPLRGREYQRHGEGEWVLIHSDRGFA